MLRLVHTAFHLLDTNGTRSFFPLGVQNFTDDQMSTFGAYIKGFTDEPDIETTTEAMSVADIDALKSHLADMQSIIDGLNADKAALESAVAGLTTRLTDANAANQALRDQIAAATADVAVTPPAPQEPAVILGAPPALPADTVPADAVVAPDATTPPVDTVDATTADASAADTASKRGRPAKDDSNL